MSEIADPKSWAEFGIAGVVIFAAFSLIFFLLKEHRAERREWKSDANRQSDQVVAALDKLTDAIRK